MAQLAGRIKIQRGERRFRPLWLLFFVGFIAASFIAAGLWQEVQLAASAAEETPAPPGDGARAGPVVEAVAEPVPEKQTITVPMLPPAPPPAEGEGGTDFSVPYQVPESAPVEESYFDDALFVGDSITTGISVYQAMANTTVVAATGINPGTILTKPVIRDQGGALHTVLEAMAQYAPTKIYVQLGANGVAWISQDTFIARYRELVSLIRAQHPGAQVYVQSIFPVTLEKSVGENGMYSNEKIDAYNAALMEMCREDGIPYLNAAQALRGPDGALPSEASKDGIHFGPPSYQKWFDYLKIHTVAPPQRAEGTVAGEKTGGDK